MTDRNYFPLVCGFAPGIDAETLKDEADQRGMKYYKYILHLIELGRSVDSATINHTSVRGKFAPDRERAS